MYASKENARKAYNVLNANGRSLGSEQPVTFERADLKLVFDFLTAAERKLPTEAAYRRAKKKPRKRTKLANG